jgi:hypothetical protein
MTINSLTNNRVIRGKRVMTVKVLMAEMGITRPEKNVQKKRLKAQEW